MIRKEAQEGTLASFYTLKGWFVKVKQAYAIDKVEFSFVQKGQHGDGFDIYVGFDEFDNLCDEILSGQFMSKLANDNGKYPEAWKYVTGGNGSKELAIGKGQSQPIVIQGRVKDAKKSAFVGVADYNKLKNMAKWFKRSSKQYMEEMCTMINQAAVYKPQEETVEDAVNITVTTSGAPVYQEKDDSYYIPVVITNGLHTKLCLRSNSLQKIGNWNAFLHDVSKMPIRFSVRAKKFEDCYLFLDQFLIG